MNELVVFDQGSIDFAYHAEAARSDVFWKNLQKILSFQFEQKMKVFDQNIWIMVKKKKIYFEKSNKVKNTDLQFVCFFIAVRSFSFEIQPFENHSKIWTFFNIL